MLCPQGKCPHWGKATKYPRKCFYEPMCWRGYVDMMVGILQLRWRLWFKK